jgi:hypothetical protein
MNELLDWAEKAGLENLQFRLQNAETLAKEAASTLVILLAGMGGAMAYAVKGFEQETPTALAIGAAALSVWLMIVGGLLVVFCMLTTSLPTPTNEPMNLYQKNFSLEAIREVELRNLQERIKQTAARNHRVAAWLDRTRLLALASPLIFTIAAAAWAAR